MKNKKQITIFEGKKIRRYWDEEKELWYFSVADVVRVLTNSVDAGAYWRKLKQRLKEEGSKVVIKCHGLKFMANDGKYYVSDGADTETMFRKIVRWRVKAEELLAMLENRLKPKPESR